MVIRVEEKKQGRKARIGSFAAAAVCGGAAFACFLSAFGFSWDPRHALTGSIAGGLARIWNAVADAAGAGAFRMLPKFAERGADGTGAALTILLGLFIVLSALLIRSRVRAALLILPVPFLAAGLFWHVWPDPYAAAVLTAGLTAAIGAAYWGDDVSLSFFIGPAAALLLTTALLFGLGSVDLSPATAFTTRVRESAAEKIDDLRYGRDGRNAGEVGALEGASRRAVSRDRGEALRITGTPEKPIWLRGFVGETWTGTAWESADAPAAYSMCDLTKYLREKSFAVQNQNAAVQRILRKAHSADSKGSTLTIRNTGADRSVLYTPYELASQDPGGRSVAGIYTRADGFFGCRKYSFRQAPASTASWTDLASALFSGGESPEKTAYLEAESRYAAVVYKRDTALSTGDRAAAKKLLGAPLRGRTHEGYWSAIEEVRTALDRNFVYSENFRASGARRNAVSAFLKSGRGCDVHFASLAVLLFRYRGIPARYVEGYLVTDKTLKNSAASASDGPSDISVPESAWHAWPEIYVDGYGWVPVEVSPDWTGTMPEADLSRGLEALPGDGRTAVVDNAADTGSENAAKQLSRARKAAGRGVLILLLMLAAAVLAGALRRWLKEKILPARARRKYFRTAPPAAASAAMLAYAEARGLILEPGVRARALRVVFSTDEASASDRAALLDGLDAAEKQKRRTARAERRAGRRMERERRRAARAARRRERALTRGKSGTRSPGVASAAARSVVSVLLIAALLSAPAIALTGCAGSGQTPSARSSASKEAAKQKSGRGERDADILRNAASGAAGWLAKNVPEPVEGDRSDAWTVVAVSCARHSGLLSEKQMKKQFPKSWWGSYRDSARSRAKAGKLTGADAGTAPIRTAAALSSIGIDAGSVEGVDLWNTLDSPEIPEVGINAEISALLAAQIGGKTLKNDAVYRQDILSAMLENGAVSADGRTPDPDLTAMAVQALAPDPSPASQQAAEKMLAYLSSVQNRDGSFDTCETTAQAAIALCQAGRDPADDGAFTKDGSLLDGLLMYQTKRGGFAHQMNGRADRMATEQALIALDSAAFAKKGERIYEKRD